MTSLCRGAHGQKQLSEPQIAPEEEPKEGQVCLSPEGETSRALEECALGESSWRRWHDSCEARFGGLEVGFPAEALHGLGQLPPASVSLRDLGTSPPLCYAPNNRALVVLREGLLDSQTGHPALGTWWGASLPS